MGDKVVNSFLPTLEIVPDWLVTSKILMMCYSLMIIKSLVMEILTVSHYLVEKWVFLVQIKMILKQLFMSDLLTAWGNRSKQHKLCTKYVNKELMPVAKHPTKW